MKNNRNFNLLFFFAFPFLLLWKTIKYSLYYFIIIIFLMTLFIYLILPINHNIFVIYKLLYLIKELIKYLCVINPCIILQLNNLFLNYNINWINDISFILDPNKQYIVYAKLNTFYDALTIITLMKDNYFFVYFYNKKNFYLIERKIANFIEILQRESINKKDTVAIKLIICSQIPDDNFFKNNYNKNKAFFVLLSHKDKASILYSKNNIYNNNMI